MTRLERPLGMAPLLSARRRLRGGELASHYAISVRTVYRDLKALQAVALAVFQDAQGVRRTLGREESADAVRSVLNIGRAEALAFLDDEELNSGILVSRVEGEVEFWHLSFQEYLAALAVSAQDDYWHGVSEHLFDDRWNELVLLLGGCRRRVGIRAASTFIRRILQVDESLAGRARAVGLVGRVLRDILPYGGDPAHGTGYDEALRSVLAVFERGAKPAAESTRVEVGEALGQAGDPQTKDDDHPDRVLMRGGSFRDGAQKIGPKEWGYDEAWDHEAPVHQVTLAAFYIDRYPVTGRQFRRFVDAADKGYLNERFWLSEAWTWREGEKRTQPSSWEKQLRHANWPVVGVRLSDRRIRLSSASE